MESINLFSSVQRIEVNPANRAVTILRGGPTGLQGPPGTDGVDGAAGANGAPITEGTGIPSGSVVGLQEFYFQTDGEAPRGLIASGQVAATSTLTPLTSSTADIPGCTTGSLALKAGDKVDLSAIIDSVCQANITNIIVLDINGVEHGWQVFHRTQSASDRLSIPGEWLDTISADGNYTYKLRARAASGSGGSIGITHTTLKWKVYR